MLPSELADHLQSLLPDINAIYEVVLLDSLPSNARDAALQQTGLAAMAAAADQVVLGNRSLDAASASISALSSGRLSRDCCRRPDTDFPTCWPMSSSAQDRHSLCDPRPIWKGSLLVFFPELMSDAFGYPSAAASTFSCLGKRQRRGSSVTPGSPSSAQQRSISSLSTPTQEAALSVFCRRQRRLFPLDSGADVSVFPAS